MLRAWGGKMDQYHYIVVAIHAAADPHPIPRQVLKLVKG